MFWLPASDGTPLTTPDKPAQPNSRIATIDDSFLICVTHQNMDENMEMPLFVADIDRTSWKKLWTINI